MPKRFLVFQSLWAMENIHHGHTAPLEDNLQQIAAAGFDGITDHYYQPAHARRLAALAGALDLQIEGQVFPGDIQGLIPALEAGQAFGCHHITIQADLRPRSLREAIRILEGWQRLAEQVAFPVLLETHRYRLNNDLLFTLDLLEQLPDLKLLADLSHYVVAREFPLPPSPADQQQIHTILQHSWGFHGRVSNGQQIQLPLCYPHHQAWRKVFEDWWRHGMSNWQQRATADQTLSFTCELGPAPYAITNAAGLDIVDRWQDSLLLMQTARRLWSESTHALPVGQT